MPGWGWSRLADPYRQGSFAHRFRERRQQRFLGWLPRGARTVLDVGGTSKFWEGINLEITVLSPNSPEPGVRWVQGTVKDLYQFSDAQFDVAFSNSVVEHVGEDRGEMARQLPRIGRSFWLQTPNRHFPVEPHFLFPGFQFLPIEQRIWLVQHFNLGWCGRIRDPELARSVVEEISLLDRSELQTLFPTATIEAERFLGLNKSWVAHFAHDG